MRNRAFLNGFVKGEHGRTGAMHTEDGPNGLVLYSYQEAIAVRLNNGTVMIDLDTPYSNTTTRQRSTLLSALIGKDWHNHTRENIRTWAGLDPTTPPTVTRVGRTCHRATTGSVIRMGERL